MNLAGKLFGIMLFGCIAAGINPLSVRAENTSQIERQTRTVQAAHIDAPLVLVYSAPSEAAGIAGRMTRGETCEVLERGSDGWIKIDTGSKQGYIRTDKAVTLMETAMEVVDKAVVQRKQVIAYATQFVGGRYVYGGSDPNTGVDCSGFTRYVMQHAAGISLPHSSSAQSSYGRSVSYEEALPGDLLFYGGKSYINHVAIYIGNDQVVHASTAKTGIKISEAKYRKPVKIVRLLES